jgi:hypothetical protein
MPDPRAVTCSTKRQNNQDGTEIGGTVCLAPVIPLDG